MQGFSFCIWFYLEQIDYDRFHEKNWGIQKLLTIHGSGLQGGGGLECFIIRGSVYYRVIPTIYSEPVIGSGCVFLCQVKPRSWNFLGLSHEAQKKFTASHLHVYFNNENCKSISLDFPKLNPNMQLQRFSLCENLLGKVSAILIMNSSSSKIKQIQQFHGQGLQGYSQIKNLPVTLDKHMERLILLFEPEHGVIENETRMVYDLVGDYEGVLMRHSGLVDRDWQRFKLGEIGGFNAILCLVYLSAMIKGDEMQKCANFCECLRILNLALKNRIQVQQEAESQLLFCTLGSLISAFKFPILSFACVEALQETKLILNEPKLIDQVNKIIQYQLQFFACILWNGSVLSSIRDEQTLQSFFKIGFQYYHQNLTHYTQLVNFKELLDLIIYTFEGQSSKCCDYHISIFYPDQPNIQIDVKLKIQLSLMDKMYQMANLLNDLNENLLLFESYFLSKYFQNIKGRYLSYYQKYFLVDQSEQQGVLVKKILSLWSENKIYQSLLYLFQTSLCVHVKSSCIQFITLIFQQKFQGWSIQQQEAVQFIESYFKELQLLPEKSPAVQQPQPAPIIEKSPIQQVLQTQNTQTIEQPLSPQLLKPEELKITKSRLRQLAIDTSEKFQHLVETTPKHIQMVNKEQEADMSELKNLGTQFLNNDYESVPVAPSMINRRKPGGVQGNNNFFDFPSKGGGQNKVMRGFSPKLGLSLNEEEQEFELKKGGDKRQKPSFSVDSSQSRVKPRKLLLNIQIDTESINQLYTYGGEKGKKVQIDDLAFQEEMKQIERLAKACVAHMKGERVSSDIYEHRMPENKSIAKVAPLTTKQKNVVGMFSESLKKKAELNLIKELSISMNSSEVSLSNHQQQNASNPSGQLTNSRGNQSQSQINYSYKESSTSPAMEAQKNSSKSKQKWNGVYISIIGWMIDKLSVGEVEEIMIEEGDTIKNAPLLNVIVQLYNSLQSDDLLKVQIVQDLLCLAKSDSSNCSIIFSQPLVHSWLLTLLLKTVPETSPADDNLKLLWEIGSRLYIHLITSVIIRENYAWQKLMDIIHWGDKQGIYKLKANILIRTLLSSIFDHLTETCKHYQPDLNVILWKNIVNISFNILLLLIGYGMRELAPETHFDILSYINHQTTSKTTKKQYWLDRQLCTSFILITDFLFAEIHDFQSTEILLVQDKQLKIKEFFENDNAKIFNQIYNILTYETENGRIDFILQLFCIYEAILQSGLKDHAVDKLDFAISRVSQLIVSLSIFGESLFFSSQRNKIDVAIDAFLSLLNFFFTLTEKSNQLLDQVVVRYFKPLLHSLFLIMVYIEDRRQGVTGQLKIIDIEQEQLQQQPVQHGFLFSIFQRQLFPKKPERKSSVDIFVADGEVGSLDDLLQMFKAQSFSQDVINRHIIKSQQFRGFLSQASELSFGLNSDKLKIQVLEYQNIGKQWFFLPTESLVNVQERQIQINHREKFKKEIYISGEQKQGDQEDRRKLYLQIESEKERSGRNIWKKIWKRERQFSGWFAPPDFYSYSQVDQVLNDQEYVTFSLKENPYFKYKIFHKETKSKAKPFLKLLMKEPPAIDNGLKSPVSFGNQTKQPQQLIIKSVILSEPFINPPSSNSSPFELNTQQLYKTANQIFNMGKYWGNNIKNTIKTILPNPTSILNMPPPKDMQTISQESQAFTKGVLEDNFTVKKVQWIRTLTIRSGFLSLGPDHLMLFFYIICLRFQYEYLNEKATHASLASHKLLDCRRLIKQWPLEMLKEVIRKKYLQRKSAMEVFLMDGSSLFFNFPEISDMEEVTTKLVRLRKTSTKCPLFTHYKSMDPKKMAEKSGLTKAWQTGEISNFYYLMQLNNFSSRSYNDLTQYPVFPWVLKETNQELPSFIKEKKNRQSLLNQIELYPPGQFRDLQLTMGALGSEQRIGSYIERFENQDAEIPAFHFGSHYSSPAITSQYLLRLQPFTSAAKEIQGGRFDIADRLFFSIQESYRCATEDVADVRELIPEMYCLPEMFLNLQGLDFGKTQSGIYISGVLLPTWASCNPFKYIVGMKQAFESEYISTLLPEWIDLIFGYKQRGKEAIKSLNTFFYLTYDDLIDLDKITDHHQRISIETQIINFGQTPLQLFQRQHVGRIQEDPKEAKMITQFDSEIKVFRPQGKKKSGEKNMKIINVNQANEKAILKIKWVSQVRLICIRRDGKCDHLKWWSTGINIIQPIPSSVPFSCGLEKQSQLNFEKPQKEVFNIYDYGVSMTSYPIQVLNYGKIFALGGYWDGRLILMNSENGNVQNMYNQHSSTITCMSCDKNENFLITGSKHGQCVLWKIHEQQLSVRKQYFDHQDKVLWLFELLFFFQINVIIVSSELKLFATGCEGGYVNLYNMYSGQFFRSLRHRDGSPINAIVLSGRPLCCIVIQSCKDRWLHCYSINGFLIESAQEECWSLVSPMAIRDRHFQDAMVFPIKYFSPAQVYGTENGELVMRALPFLQTYKRFLISSNSPVLSVTITKDKKFILCGCNDGELSVMTEPQLKQN